MTCLSYTQNSMVTVGYIVVPVPDSMNYAAIGSNYNAAHPIPADLSNRMDFICVPQDDPHGFEGYQYSSVSLFLNKPLMANGLDALWENQSVKEVAEGLLPELEGMVGKQAKTKPLRIVQKKKGFMTCCGLFSGDDNPDTFWRSFVFFIVTGSVIVAGMFYFNQKAKDSELEAVVKEWLLKVQPAEMGKEQLGPYTADNGKADAIVVANLFFEDVLFFPEIAFDRSSGVPKLNIQFNAIKNNEHPYIAQNLRLMIPGLSDLFMKLDNAKELKIPKSKLHKKLLGPLLDDGLTGLSFLNLMAYHMVKIIEKEKPNDYLVVVDQNIIAGMPDAYRYICKFIKFAREYNDKFGAFSVLFMIATNFDSPISGTLKPVAGSAQGEAAGGMCGYIVQADGTISDGSNSSVKVDSCLVDGDFGIGQADSKASMTVAELEELLDDEIVDRLKNCAQEVLATFKKLPAELKSVEYENLSSIEEVIEQMREAISLNLVDYGVRGILEIPYIADELYDKKQGSSEYSLFVQYEKGRVGDGSFNPNDLPNELIGIIDNLTEKNIYQNLLTETVMARDAELDEKKKNKERIEKKQIEKETAKQNAKEAAEKEQRTWEAECVSIQQKKEAERLAGLKKLKEREQQELEELKRAEDEEIVAVEKLIADTEKAIDDAKEVYTKLGFMAFSKKKALQKQIDANEAMLLELKSKLAEIRNIYAIKREDLKYELDRERSDLDKRLVREYLAPITPEERRIAAERAKAAKKEHNLRLTEKQKEEEKWKNIICNIMEHDMWYSLSDIWKSIYDGYSSQKTMSRLRDLEDEGRVIRRNIDGKAYFCLAD